MLPRSARLTNSEDFRRTIRRGVRIGRSTLVVHAAAQAPVAAHTPVRVGFVVSKAVGNAVVRNSVKRRLRHLARDLVATTPAGTDLVVRALPPAAAVRTLPADLADGWGQALAVLQRRGSRPSVS